MAEATATATDTYTGGSYKDDEGNDRANYWDDVYGTVEDNLRLDSQQFRTKLYRADAKAASDRVTTIDGIVDSIDWTAESGNPVLTGNLSLQMPRAGGGVFIHEGHELALEVYWGGRWQELWRMRLDDGADTLSGGRTYTMADDMQVLQESTDDFHYTKSKKKGKPKGWLCHEIVADIAKKYRIPLGKIAAGTKYITDLSLEDVSPLQVIQKAYALEKTKSGRRFVIRWQGGKLNVLPMRRNPLLYILGPMITDATVGIAARDENFATAVTVSGTYKKAKKGKKSGKDHDKDTKFEELVFNEAGIKTYGFVHKKLDGQSVTNDDGAVAKGKRWLAKHSVRKRTITSLTHPGIAFLRRGDGIEVSLADYGFDGNTGVCFIASGTWQITGGLFTMSLDLTFDDPWITTRRKRQDKDKAARKEKRDARNT